MKYRKFGTTGFDISALGFGCMHFPEFEKDGKWYIDEEKTIPMLHRAVELGINYFDTAFYYCHQNSQYTVGKALKPFRDQVKISTKIPMGNVKEPADYRKILEESLRRMDTDYIDYYHMWGIDKKSFDEIITPNNLMKEALKAKEEGLIKHISFSFHDEPENMRYIIDRGEVFESVLCQYNLLDRANEEAIDYAVSKGLGVVAMGPVAGGRLAAPTGLYEKLTGKKSTATYELALKFVLGNKNIACALSGMSTLEMVEQNAAAATAGDALSEEELSAIKTSMAELAKFSDLYCTGCNYCNVCPQKIAIPSVFNDYTLYNVYGLTEAAKRNYKEFLKELPDHTPDKCTDCGLCETKCPQKLQIRKELKRVDALLRSL